MDLSVITRVLWWRRQLRHREQWTDADLRDHQRRETAALRAFTWEDPDFDRWDPLSAVMSLLTTSPPGPLAGLATPTMFMLARRDAAASCLCSTSWRCSSAAGMWGGC